MKRAGEVLGYKATKVKALGTYRCSFCNKWHLTSKI